MSFSIFVFLGLYLVDKFLGVRISSDLMLFIVLMTAVVSLGCFYGFRKQFYTDVDLVERLLRLK